MSEKVGYAPTGHPNDQDEKHTNGLLGSAPDSHTERDIEGELANAPLIAAAPELLEACKSLLTLTQLMANEAYDDEAIVEFEIFSEKTKSTRCLVLVFELAKARAAIAKATGRADSGQAAQGDRHE